MAKLETLKLKLAADLLTSFIKILDSGMVERILKKLPPEDAEKTLAGIQQGIDIIANVNADMVSVIVNLLRDLDTQPVKPDEPESETTDADPEPKTDPSKLKN